MNIFGEKNHIKANFMITKNKTNGFTSASRQTSVVNYSNASGELPPIAVISEAMLKSQSETKSA